MFVQSKPYQDLYRPQPAASPDLPRLYQLLKYGEYVHLQLDWWSLEDWVGNPAFIIASRNEHVAGFSLAIHDDSPVAWWRALAAAEGHDPGQLFDALLKPTLQALRQLHSHALTCMAFSDWLDDVLSELGFDMITQVITLRKDNRHMPVSGNNVFIRPATQTDIPDVLIVDQAAFEPTWRYGLAGLSRIWGKTRHKIVAEQNGQVIGYACGEANKSNGHVVRLAVNPAHQGQNVGAALLAAISRSFFAAGVKSITLNTQVNNATSQKLYNHFKFQPVGYPVNVWQLAAD